MAQVIWTDPALQNLDEIADNIALENLEAAKKLVSLVFQRTDLLGSVPLMGNVPDELKGTLYRRLVIWVLYLYYRIDEGRVIIIHLRRAEREFSLEDIEGVESEA